MRANLRQIEKESKEEREVKAKKWIEKKFSQGFLPKVKKAVRR